MIRSVNDVSSMTDLKLALTYTNTNTNTRTMEGNTDNVNGRNSYFTRSDSSNSSKQQSLQFDDPILRAMRLRDVAISIASPSFEDSSCDINTNTSMSTSMITITGESDKSPAMNKTRSNINTQQSSSASSAIDQFLYVPAENTPFSSKAWVLDNHDPATTFPQTLDAEVRRLLVLRSYLVLDAPGDAASMGFDGITRLASRMLDCPIAMVSLSDMERQWILSRHGLGDEVSKEFNRKNSFCAHTLLNKSEDGFVVNDASQDSRFQNNPVVTGPMHVRFYAGVPLVSPEGYRLGTLCVIGHEGRPNGLALEDKQNLKDLADMIVEGMARRRKEKIRAHFHNPKQTIAQMAHELLTPLRGVQLNLSTLADDSTLTQQMTSEEQELLSNAMYCSDAVAKICATAIDELRQQQDGLELAPEQGDSLDGSKRSNFFRKTSTHSEAVQTENLIQAWFIILEAFPKKVPVSITLDPSVPDEIFLDELKVFRAALNYLSNACHRTVKGSIQLVVKMVSSDTKVISDESRTPETIEEDSEDSSRTTEIRKRRKVSSDEYSSMKDDGSSHTETQKYLFVECIDTAPNIPIENYPLLFHPSEYHENVECIRPTANGGCEPICRMQTQGLGLYSVAIQIGSIGGEYGFQPRISSTREKTIDASATDVNGNLQGSIFWFKVPINESN